MKTPNLFVIGATKCATTTLHRYLDAHPAISMSSLKEPGFFLEQWERHPAIQATGRNEDEEIENYLSLFADKPEAQYRGESSTAYTHRPQRTGVVERISEFCERPRFIYVMRDPVERTISHYWWNVRNEGERRPLLNALCDDPTYRDVSYYAMQLRPYLDTFGEENVRPITFESMVRDTTNVLAGIFDWLGVDLGEAQGIERRQENKTPPVVTASRMPWVDRFRHSRFWEQVGPLVPATLRRWMRRSTEVSFDVSEENAGDAVRYLRPIQLQQTAELSELLGRSFEDWSTLYETPPIADMTQSKSRVCTAENGNRG